MGLSSGHCSGAVTANSSKPPPSGRKISRQQAAHFAFIQKAVDFNEFAGAPGRGKFLGDPVGRQPHGVIGVPRLKVSIELGRRQPG